MKKDGLSSKRLIFGGCQSTTWQEREWGAKAPIVLFFKPWWLRTADIPACMNSRSCMLLIIFSINGNLWFPNGGQNCLEIHPQLSWKLLIFCKPLYLRKRAIVQGYTLALDLHADIPGFNPQYLQFNDVWWQVMCKDGGWWDLGILLPVWVDNSDLNGLVLWFSMKQLYMSISD